MSYDSERWKLDIGLLGLLIFILLPLAAWILMGAQNPAKALQALLGVYGALSLYGMLILAYAVLRLGHIMAGREP